ncbi:hypothetical protein BDP27DRAFT_674584 [Rhodocollybia butyracea]|uniref:ZZ-type domain-containing protein n=1 Tax=Rhodocollybia butyracea TaxID=206335 RepID=A0A9P5PV94_9AGAR|nr:hypothetical protein BDP27DRAFT_674584 [Rhodocollybia butyracea]
MNRTHPDKPLVVKCDFNGNQKKISFHSAQNCSYGTLRDKIEQCFALYTSAFSIVYFDDGEEIPISAEDHLTEAISYFQADEGTSSIRSGFSFGTRKITLRVQILVEYEGPSLSDAGSIISVEEYRSRNGSARSFSFGGSNVEPDDDSVTVSSRDNGGRPSAPSSVHNHRTSASARASQLSGESSWDSLSRMPSNYSRSLSQNQDPFADSEPPVNVFERLKAAEDDSPGSSNPIVSDHAAWLKEQHERAYRSLGVLPEPSVSNEPEDWVYEQEDQVGALSLQRAPTGKYYYMYGSEASPSQQGTGVDEDSYEFNPSIEGGINGKPRPTSRQLNWVAAQQEVHQLSQRSDPSLETLGLPELLRDIPPNPPGEADLTLCSECGLLLDYMKYVCYTCGEKEPGLQVQTQTSFKGKDRDSSPTYPPRPNIYTSPLSSSFSSSSRTFIGGHSAFMHNPLPQELTVYSFTSSTLALPPSLPKEIGYELCPNCVEVAGVTHAVEAVVEPGSSPIASDLLSSSSEDAALQWRRAAPKEKGQLRHAYVEKMWGHYGWEDVVQSEAHTENCSACGVKASPHKLYKCASCPRHYLCRACYSQVHDLHPSHAFLVLPGKSLRSLSDSDFLAYSSILNATEEQSMIHPGVRCTHCLREIVGARFHCAECDDVDICSNCESAGLPGNMDSADGGHNSSHILIKIPTPLATSKVQSVSRTARNLWTSDPANVNRVGPSKAKSEISSYARTVVGSGSNRTSEPIDNEDHGIDCSACRKPISGVRYQCANCPAPNLGYNLCASCERHSYTVHDPRHAFFKLPRPVHRHIQSNFPMIPVLYKVPAGPSPRAFDTGDPTDYLKSIIHPAAVCDLCFTRIQGAWFHCAHCAKDFCSGCESVDTHDDTHVFLVFKTLIDMKILRCVLNRSLHTQC